jgi:RIO kinase 1
MPKNKASKHNQASNANTKTSGSAVESVKSMLETLRRTSHRISYDATSSEQFSDHQTTSEDLIYDIFTYVDSLPQDEELAHFVEELLEAQEATMSSAIASGSGKGSGRPSLPQPWENEDKKAYHSTPDAYDYNSESLEDVYDGLEAELLGEDVNPANIAPTLASDTDLGKRINLSNRIQNEITKSVRKSERRTNTTGKDDRATSEQVLDPRTRLILFRLLSNGFLSEIDGCLSTGKEANVYYGRSTGNGIERQYAIKIFKTSILVFKDRDRYVTGNFRFRYGYCKSNPRRMVRTWAEKEMRNLKRLVVAGIPCPVPHLLKAHVLIMDFIGEKGWCAPRLKDVHLNAEELSRCYKTLIVYLRQMYTDCNLVHGDYSEYNILWHSDQPFIIDVSQAVETSHPFASEFLRKDINNVTDFFTRHGLRVLSNYTVFRFVTDPKLFDSSGAASSTPRETTESTAAFQPIPGAVHSFSEIMMKLEEVMESGDEDTAAAASVDDEHAIGSDSAHVEVDGEASDGQDEEDDEDNDDAVFMQSYIPSSLHEISNPYQVNIKIIAGEREAAYADAILDMIDTTSKPLTSINEEDDEAAASDEDKASGSDSDDGDDDSSSAADQKYRRVLPPHEDAELRRIEKEKRKAAKKLAKEAAAEKRKHKMPKHLKKQAIERKKGK